LHQYLFAARGLPASLHLAWLAAMRNAGKGLKILHKKAFPLEERLFQSVKNYFKKDVFKS